jgi:hypothetical protein
VINLLTNYFKPGRIVQMSGVSNRKRSDIQCYFASFQNKSNMSTISDKEILNAGQMDMLTEKCFHSMQNWIHQQTQPSDICSVQ